MGIFKRLSNLVKSNTNELIDRAEDPEKMLNQTIVDMSNQLVDAKKQVADSIATEKRLRKQWETELEKSKGWKEKAAMAVRASDDALAKEALGRKREHEELADELQKQWESQRQAVDQLKVALRGLNSKIEEAKRKKNVLIAKKRRADTQKQIQQTIGSMGEAGAFETFERMEKKIEQAESEAESIAELNEEKHATDLDGKFKALEASSSEDMELLELKEELGLLGGKTSADDVVGQLEGKTEEESPLDSELEAMKKQLGSTADEVEPSDEGAPQRSERRG
jgi:phage shock protein A